MAKGGPTWPPPPLPLALADGEVHVWRADLAAAAAREEALRHLMGEEERARAGRFAFERDRQRFVAAHGALRTILARYLGVGPRGLRFSSGQWGKPALLRERPDEDLRK